MKTETKQVNLNPPLIPGQSQIGNVDAGVEIQRIEKDQTPTGHSNIDAMQSQPPRTEQGDASSNVSRGESSQISVRRQHPGVRTKKLKTEVVGSMPRPGRAAFHEVHSIVGQGKAILGTKPHQTEPRE